MYISICIPQFNRTDHVIELFKSIERQDFESFEICVSDGGSTDGRTDEVESYLRTSGLPFKYIRSVSNVRYDANLRSAISLASGRYAFLMGNDDALSDSAALSDVARALKAAPSAVAAVTNYMEQGTKTTFRRMTSTGLLGSGPLTAARVFRHYAFVSGVIFDGQLARAAATDCVDGSEMYQMYLGSRLVAAGGDFLAIDRLCVVKDIQISGQQVDSYRLRGKVASWPLREHRQPMGRLLETVWSGIDVGSDRVSAMEAANLVAQQLYAYTYPFWIFEHRRVQSYGYALGFYWGLRPSVVAAIVPFTEIQRAGLWVRYLLGGVIAFLSPLWLFDGLRPSLYRLAKRSRLSSR